jgi:hypothetical protein
MTAWMRQGNLVSAREAGGNGDRQLHLGDMTWSDAHAIEAVGTDMCMAPIRK